MKRVTGILLLCMSLLAAACGSPEPDTSGGPVAPSETFMERYYSFREEGDSTRFVIGFEGASVMESDIRLCIIARKGDTLYTDTLIAEEMVPGLTSMPDSMRADRVLESMQKMIDKAPKKAAQDSAAVSYWFAYKPGLLTKMKVGWDSQGDSIVAELHGIK